jgi:catechol 2,3-dioxygenase-like lactoylglutathione lyase family enzyme
VPVQLNHTIVNVRDRDGSARFYTEVLGLADPIEFGPFLEIVLDNDAILALIEAGPEWDIEPQHYAFLVGEDDFDAIFGRIKDRGLTYWADPHKQQPGEINTHFGGRGVYWADPDGHLLEIITQPYSNEA